MPMSGAIEGFKGDVFTNLDIAIECKNQEKIQIWKAFEQAQQQATGLKMPVLFISGNSRPILAIMNAEDWINIYKEYRESFK